MKKFNVKYVVKYHVETTVESEDKDGDLIGYKVYVSRYSRGWNNTSDNKRKVLKSESLEDYYNRDNQDWHPKMLDLLYKESAGARFIW